MKRFDRSFAGLGGANAARSIGRRCWLLSQTDVMGRACESRPLNSNETLGGDVLCLLGLDLMTDLGIMYDPRTKQCFRHQRHGPLEGQEVEIPVCQCVGSHLPMIRVDQYEDTESADGSWLQQWDTIAQCLKDLRQG